MTKYLPLGLAALALLLPASPSKAVTYTKHNYGSNLPGNAEITYGVGPIDAITDSTSLNFTTLGSERTTLNQSVADLFLINITGLTPFSATTVGQTGNPGPGTSDVFNTALYLFDLTGKGVLTNDDDPNGFAASAYRSTIAPITLPSGLYYLGIGVFGDEPISSGGLIFPDQLDPTVDTTQTYGPSGPGGTLPLSGWRVTNEDVESGTYTVALTGVNFAAVPEPAPLALLAAGGLLLVAGLRRRRTAM